MRTAISEWLRTTLRTAPSLLVMGVTPELCGLPMNAGSRVIAVDKSVDMIRRIWPGRLRMGDETICGDWRHMPLANSSVDLVLGDGSLSALAYPSGYSAVFSELCRVLRPGGRCVIRCFMQADERETPEKVFAELSRGRIGNFHALKWRLAMALQADLEAGVSVKSVWSALHSAWPDPDLLARRFAWPSAEVLTIRAYCDVDTRYTFPTLAEYREFFLAAGFSVTQMATPSYELGERCPTFVLEPLASKVSPV